RGSCSAPHPKWRPPGGGGAAGRLVPPRECARRVAEVQAASSCHPETGAVATGPPPAGPPLRHWHRLSRPPPPLPLCVETSGTPDLLHRHALEDLHGEAALSPGQERDPARERARVLPGV